MNQENLNIIHICGWSNNHNKINNIIFNMSAELDMNELEDVNYLLCLKFASNMKGLITHQSKYNFKAHLQF